MDWLSILSATYVVVMVILLFGLSIFVHELGHFLAARAFGMVIDVFSIGFGPALWKRTVNGIVYKIACIPIGGYVALPQLDPTGMQTLQGAPAAENADAAGTPREAASEPPPRRLPPVAPWKKMIVSLSGAAGNFLLAVALAWIVYLAERPSAPTETSALIGTVDADSPAYAAGLRPGDTILAVNGERVRTWQEFLQIAALNEQVTLRIAAADGHTTRECAVPTTTNATTFGLSMVAGLREGARCRVAVVQPGSRAAQAGLQSGDLIRTLDGQRIANTLHMIELIQGRAESEVVLGIERRGAPLELRVTPAYDAQAQRARIGIEFGADIMTPAAQLRHDATSIVRILRALLTPRQSKKAAQGLGGPVSILAVFWLHMQSGLLLALGFTRLLNVNLAILNLLPIPVLDGGHIVFALWEAVTRKPVHERVVGWLVNTCAVLLIGAMLLLTWQDLFRWIPMWRQAARTTDTATASGSLSNAVETTVAP